MARYFFHLYNDHVAIDEEGQEINSFDALVARAVRYTREMAAMSVIDHGRIRLHHRIDVADERGAIVHTVRFGDVVQIEE